jgi:hypothetical protein
MSECKNNIDAFLAKNFKNWRGLSAGCSEQDITRWYAFLDGFGVSRRGKAQIEYNFRVMSHPGFKSGVEFYFRDSKLQLLETEFWSNDSDECSRLLMLIGEPEHRLDLYWRDWSVPSGLWLWTHQGISIGLAPETRLIVYLTVFPPCTRETYEHSYYQISGTREFR